VARALVGAILVALLLAPVGAAAWEPNAALIALYEKAKAENDVVISGPATNEIEWIPAEFAKRFPGIAVKTVADLQGATKFIAEARAGLHSFDVWSFSLGGMIEVQKRGLLETVDWPRYGLDAKNVVFDGQAMANHNFVYSVVYAKDHVAAAELPHKWDDLLDPRWAGRMTAQSFLLPRLMGMLALDWGPERTEKWGRALIDQQKILVTNAPAAGLLKTGERVLAVGDSVSLSYRYSADGVASGYVIMDLVPAVQFAVARMKDAPHPNAATLLAAWLASDEGRDLYDRVVHEADIRPGSTSSLAREIAATKSKIILEDVATMDQRAEYYKNFSALVRGEK
jgi:iron(III) transport system substrate-binding protein